MPQILNSRRLQKASASNCKPSIFLKSKAAITGFWEKVAVEKFGLLGSFGVRVLEPFSSSTNDNERWAEKFRDPEPEAQNPKP